MPSTWSKRRLSLSDAVREIGDPVVGPERRNRAERRAEARRRVRVPNPRRAA